MKVCLFGYDGRSYSKNVILIKGLEKLGIDLNYCLDTSYLSLTHYPYLFWKFVKTSRDADIIFVIFFGHYDVVLAWILSRIFRKKVVFDPLISIYNTRVQDRQYFSEKSLRAKFYILMDKINVHLSDLVFIDTETHFAYFNKMFGLKRSKMHIVRVGADETTLVPKPHKTGRRIKLLFYGSYQPSQGAIEIIKAAKVLQDLDLDWTFIGKGQQQEEVINFAKDNHLKNITFIDPMPFSELVNFINNTDICFGALGDTIKTNMVIHNKIYQGIAMGKVVITQDSDAAREILRSGVDAVLVKPTAEEISIAIRNLVKDSHKIIRIGQAARKLFLNNFTSYHVAKEAHEGFRKVLRS